MKRFDETVEIDEPWTIVIDCNDDQGADITPTTATFTMGDETGVKLTKTQVAGITIEPGKATILISTGDQAALGGEGLYFAKLVVAVGAGPPSLQAGGTILVERVRP
jgi:hypothetical protein